MMKSLITLGIVGSFFFGPPMSLTTMLVCWIALSMLDTPEPPAPPPPPVVKAQSPSIWDLQWHMPDWQIPDRVLTYICVASGLLFIVSWLL